MSSARWFAGVRWSSSRGATSTHWRRCATQPVPTSRSPPAKCRGACSSPCPPRGWPRGSGISLAQYQRRREHDSYRPLSLVELGSALLFDEPSLERSALCHALDVSEGHFSRSFQRELGIAFAQQRARMRIARFVTHVTRDRWNYLDAALASGFGSYSQLYRAFTRVVQVRPGRYFSLATRNLRANITSLS